MLTFITINSNGDCWTCTAAYVISTGSGTDLVCVSPMVPALKLNPQGEAVRRWSLWGFALVSGIGAFIKDTQRAPSSMRKWVLTDTESDSTMVLKLNLQTVRNNCWLLINHSVDDVFITEARIG